MSTKRIIPCLDIKDGKVVKGTNFVSLRELGDPIQMAQVYSEAGADELVLLDITATNETRKTKLNLVDRVKKAIFIPLIIGGGIGTLTDMSDALSAGADKVSIGSAAILQPDLISEAAARFGSNRLVISIDAKKKGKTWQVMMRGGTEETGRDVVQWAREVEKRGAGEILLTSMDRDGVKSGFDIELTKAVTDAVDIPIIASGGVGSLDDFVTIFKKTKATAALAASIFHEGTFSVQEVKQYCLENGVKISET